LCNASDHDINLCPYYTCYAQPDFVSPLDNTDVVLTLHDSSFPLAQCMGLEEGDSFGGDARSSVVDACFESDDIFDEVHDLAETPLEGSCDVFVCEESPSLAFDDSVIPNILEHSYVSPTCSQPSILPDCSLDVLVDNPKVCDSDVNLGHEDNEFNVLGGNVDDYLSLGYLRGYDPSIDPYCRSLEDLPRKITWITCFSPFYDFSMVFD